LANFSHKDVILGDIEQAINHIYRFGGSWEKVKPLTVGQHSLLCMRLAELDGADTLTQMSCLTHDFGEAYVGDMCTAIKKLLGDSWDNFAKPIENIVDEVCNPWGMVDHDTIKHYDNLSFAIECDCIFKRKPVTAKVYRKMFHDVASYGLTPPVQHNYFRLQRLIEQRKAA
jgi:hypothetical protein